MIRKIGLFFLSLWLLFLLIIVITAEIPLCFEENCEFVGWSFLLKTNIISLFCIFALIIGFISFWDFNRQISGTPELSFVITEIENINYEHLTFLTTYIIPFVCFQFNNLRYTVNLIIILMVIGLIYIRTDLFYANPTLAILGFRIYKISGKFRDGKIRTERILITKNKLEIGDRIEYFKLDERIYYASKNKHQ